MSEVITSAHLLGNNSYGVLLAARGSGYSALRGFALTRWHPDPLGGQPGLLCYLRDLDDGAYWSTMQSDLHCAADHALQTLSVAGIQAQITIGVLRSADAEVRRILVTNHSGRARRLELTTYAELCLNTPAADAAHPAFSKLFVQTAYDVERSALLAWRRLRSPQDRPLWVAQRLQGAAAPQYETDRMRFVGRTRSLLAPAALIGSVPLSGTVGAVLDPLFSQRVVLNLEADQTTELELLLCAADTRAEVEQILDVAHPAEFADSGDAEVFALPHAWANLIVVASPASQSAHSQPDAHTPAPKARSSEHNAFSEDGTEYVIQVGGQLEPTPQPWINVVANEQCGFLISEMGAGYTWSANSRENRLTPWSNDPVLDATGEALYLRDDETGDFWSVQPGPAPADALYEVRHGFGYSSFVHVSHEIAQRVTVFVPRHDPVRISRLQLTNTSTRTRRLSLFSHAQLVLGSTPAETRGSASTEYKAGVIYARNPERGEFGARVAFVTAVTNGAAKLSATASRAVFLGRDGTMAAPAALRANTLEPQFGKALDPCAVLQLSLSLSAGETADFSFLLGEADDEDAVRACLARYTSNSDVDAALQNVRSFWQELLTRVQVRTPVPALDVMFNGWLAYQNLACRMWGRSAFYQSGGAYGFRDQLQDSSALIYLDPTIARKQILLHAAHQFSEGDVLHWWHPPVSKGIRTRFSDDLLWLPQLTHFYLARTGDRSVLDEAIRFVTAEALADDDDELFVWPRPADTSASVYEHCCRAIDRSLTKGAHGLPLMGVGDWNDGMNRVGREGRGESVWLGFFLFDILSHWIPICEARHDQKRVERYQDYRRDLHEALNDGGWDGGWYRRAYYDDGTPLGSAQNDECRIDALAQSWAVLARAASEPRAELALSAMRDQLIDEESGIIRLLTPAFDDTPHDPGYIKGYVPGVRENGGQYTHAALWAVRALAEHGQHEHAARLLEMLSPVTRSRCSAYRGEPYVIAADVYGEPPHVGRAGWTWYTGSAGWMYRVLLESILGFELVNGQAVHLRPCIPSSWPGYSLSYRFDADTIYHFEVERTDASSSTTDGIVQDGAVRIQLKLDGGEHFVRIKAGSDVRPRYRPRSNAAPLLRTTSR
jgi:N,N'-diacetylchitobiose phosphorylase